MENRKDLIKKFRAYAKGKQLSREFLLGYAFLREVPYVTLERVINEDKIERKPEYRKCRQGVFCFLYYLASSVSSEIVKIEAPEEKKPRSYYLDAVYAWMLEKYGPEDMECAA